MALRPDETFQRLRAWDYGQTLSERLAAQILADAGYSDIDPIHPRGGPDGGKDAIAIRDGRRWVMAVYFAHDAKPYAQTEAKAVSDASGVGANAAHGLAFVTNQQITAAERRSLAKAVRVPLDLFHIERLVLALDKPVMHGVRRQYLDIDYHGAAPQRTGPTEAQRLEAALGAANTRRMQRLRAAGVVEDRRPHVEAWMASHPRPSIEASQGSTVTLISAPMGYGKTELAHDWFIRRIHDAIESPVAPFPVWLRAREIDVSIEAVVIDRVGREVVHEVGCALVIDGLDELTPVNAVRVVESAEEFCGAWSRSTVVATAKPDPLLQPFVTHQVDPWLIEDGRGLAEEVAAGRLPYNWWTDEVVEALQIPLLALALGVRAATGASPPANRTALIGDIAAQSMRRARVTPSTALTVALTAIAAHTLATGKPYPASDLDPDVRAQVTATPLIVDVAGQLSFALPVLELVYAAQALADGSVSLAEIASPRHFLSWRYAIAMAVSGPDEAEADSRLAKIVATNPIAASWILDEVTSGQAAISREIARTVPLALTHEITVSDPESQLSAEALRLLRELRDAHLNWVNALGPIARQLVGAAGESLPGWTAGADESRMLVGRRRITDGVDIHAAAIPKNIFHPPTELIVDHSRVTVGARPAGPLSRWTWTRNDLREALQPRLKAFTLDCDADGTLAAERAWHLAQLVMHGGERLGHAPIRTDALVRKADEQLASCATAVKATFQVSGAHYSKEDLMWLRVWIDDHCPAGTIELSRPAPMPDRAPGSGWTWSIYTGHQMHALTEWVLRHAALGYTDLVSRNFPGFGDVLDHADMSPLHIIGELITAPDDQEDGGFADGPILNYTIRKAPDGISEPVIDISHLVRGDSSQSEVEFTQYDRWSSTVLHLEGSRPATRWAYQWLIDDLAAVGWLGNSWSATA